MSSPEVLNRAEDIVRDARSTVDTDEGADAAGRGEGAKDRIPLYCKYEPLRGVRTRKKTEETRLYRIKSSVR